MWLGAWGERGDNSLKNEREVEEAGARRGSKKLEGGGKARGPKGEGERGREEKVRVWSG